MDSKLSAEPKVVRADVTTPLRWDEDGVAWEYIPVKESE